MELRDAIGEILAAAPFKLVLSAPRAGVEYRRATLAPAGDGWQVERFSETQAFHQNLVADALADRLCALLETEFTQLNAFGEAGGFALRVSKKGKVLLRKTGAAAAHAKAAAAGHNRAKSSLLPEGTVIAPLVDMGVFTADGRVVRGMYGKYRQINRFVELVDDAFRGQAPEKLSVVDFGCGKSYLTFVLYHYLTAVRGIETEMVGLDLKADVVAGCNEAARRYGYNGLRFEVGDIAVYRRARPVDMVVTLHACDTATDHALANAVAWGAGRIFSVPCCQHELNAQMQGGNFGILTRYGLVKERVAALMTDAVRANLVTACGYKTGVLEFVETEHTPKNILLRAQRANVPPAKRRQALDEVRALCGEFGFAPTLLRLLQEKGLLGEAGGTKEKSEPGSTEAT